MTTHSKDLEGKVALVVGCGLPGAIGAVSARALAEAGAKVVLADLQTANLQIVLQDFQSHGYQAAAAAVDLVDEASVKAMLEFSLRTYGRLDAVVNNAAATHLVHRDHGVTDMTAGLWDETFAVNVRGPMFV